MLEFRFKTTYRPSNKMERSSRWIGTNESFGNNSFGDILPPRYFQIDDISVSAATQLNCSTGIEKIPLAESTEATDITNAIRFPTCATDVPKFGNEKKNQVTTIRMNISNSYFNGFRGLIQKENQFTIIPYEPPAFIKELDLNKTEKEIEKLCDQKNISTWPTVLKQDWDIGHFSGDALSKVVLSMICKKDRTTFRQRNWKNNRHCFCSLKNSNYEFEVKTDHDCLKQKTPAKFISSVKLQNVSVSMLLQHDDQRSQFKSVTCLDASVNYEYIMVHSHDLFSTRNLAMSCNPKKKSFSPPESQSQVRISRKFTPSKDNYAVYGIMMPSAIHLTRMIVSTDKLIDSDKNILIPTGIHVTGKCENTVNSIGFPSTVYSAFDEWQILNFTSTLPLNRKVRYHAYLISLSKLYYRFDYFHEKKREDSYQFQVPTELTQINLDSSIFPIVSSFIIFFTSITMVLFFQFFPVRGKLQQAISTKHDLEDFEGIPEM